MKKLFVIALAAVLVVMFSVPVTAAVKHKFNGYWRTRFFTYDNLDYLENSASLQAVDTRTRIKYTAVLHDNLKLVNYFEMDAIWGKNPKDASYGDIGADGVSVEVKNTYVDFNFANLQWAIGTQGFADATGGWIYNDDMTGMKINYRADNYVLGFRWVRAYEGWGSDQYGNVDTKVTPEGNGVDFDFYDIIFNYKAGNQRIAPFITYMKTNDGDGYAGTAGEALDVYFLGARWDMKMGNWKFFVNGIYEGGNIDDTTDVTAYVFDGEARVKMGQWGAFARFAYASGDDDTTDTDHEGWYIPGGKLSSVSNLSELWGDGKFDVVKPLGSVGKELTNAMHFGLGVDYKMSKAWNFKLSFWNLNYAEEGADSQSGAADKNIGNEIDFWATWNVMKAMKMHFLFCYLMAGDALDERTDPLSAEDPWELGGQLEIKF